MFETTRRTIPSLIHFFGPDGAGKSTHVDILIKTIIKEEPKVKKVWLRSPHTLAFLLWRLLVKVGFCRTISNPFGDVVKLPAVDRNKVMRAAWASIEFLSVLPLILHIRLLMSRGYKCVAERYVLDSVVTIAFFIGDLNFLRSRVARLLYLFAPSDTFFVFLDSDYKTVFNRRAHLHNAIEPAKRTNVYGAVPKSAVEPQEFINFQRAAYKVLARHFGAFSIDTSRHSVEETARMILNQLDLSRSQ
jgi:hypothetical protein